MPAFVLASRRLAMRYPTCIAQRARYGDPAAGALQMLIVCCDLRVRRSDFVRLSHGYLHCVQVEAVQMLPVAEMHPIAP